MKRVCRMIPMVLVLVPLSLNAQTGDRSADENAIRQVVVDYVAAWRNQNVEGMKKVLHPQARLFLPSTGKSDLVFQTPAQLYANFRSNTRDNDLAPVRDAGLTVERLELSGDIASVKIRVKARGSEVVEHLSLVKVAGDWKIVCRVMSVLVEVGQPKLS